MKDYKQMIKSELETEIETLNLQAKIKEVAKVPNKPTNAEYVTVLESYQEVSVPTLPKVVEAVSSVKPDKVDAKATKEEETATMVADLDTMTAVIITDHDNSVVIEEDDNRRLVSIRWGNPMIGMTTTQVAMHGMMQYLPKGAIIRLKKITLSEHVKDADGKEISKNDRPRFSVSDTTGWTETEFEAHAAEQRLKRI